jgi:hypothetical protein
LCSFLHSPVTSSVFDPNILLRTLFSNTHSLCSSLNVRDKVSHPYKTIVGIMVLYILNFRKYFQNNLEPPFFFYKSINHLISKYVSCNILTLYIVRSFVGISLDCSCYQCSLLAVARSSCIRPWPSLCSSSVKYNHQERIKCSKRYVWNWRVRVQKECTTIHVQNEDRL